MKKNGCLTWIIGFFVVCLLIGLYSLAWIPAIGFIIYYLIKKRLFWNKKEKFYNKYYYIHHLTLTIYLGVQILQALQIFRQIGEKQLSMFQKLLR